MNPEQIKIDEECALCGLELPAQHAILDGALRFCCPGCHAVYRILEAKQQVDQFEESPVFQQALKSGLISNPALLEQIRQKQIDLSPQELQKVHLEVGEMWCPTCAELIRLLLMREKGIKNCVVDYSTDLASIEYSPRYLSREKIFSLISSCGYIPRDLQNDAKKVSFSLYFRFVIAAFFSVNVMMFSYPLYATYFDYDTQGYGNLFAWIAFWCSVPVVTYGAWPIIKRFWNGLKLGLLGMETLVVIAVASAFGLSVRELLQGGNHVYFDSMSVIVTFVLLGKIIESKAKFSAKNAMLRLSQAMPRKGRKRFPDGKAEFVLVKEMTPGDILIAYTGEKIVLDGIVVEGEGAADESLMTGESIPVEKRPGSSLLSGTVLTQGWVAYRAESKQEESALHRIIEMVEREMGHKSVYVRAADKIVPWFVPIVIAIAALSGFASWFLGYGAEESFLRSISVLLISCPCAIGIAAPLAESHILNGMANLGAIVRNRGCLTLLGKETYFVFDKTGTITEGIFRVLKGLDEIPKDQLGALKGLASHSTHPIAAAIARSISEDPLLFQKIEEFSGKGMKGIRDGQAYFLGSGSWMRELGYQISQQSDQTTVFFTTGTLLKEIQLGDSVREEAKDVLNALRPVKTLLLSGDHPGIVSHVAKTCGFDRWLAERHPLQKQEEIESLRKQGEIVVMIGDGINDAPALTAAHIGISVVSATDISIQVSDLLLTTDRLDVIPKLRKLAVKGQRIVKQNLFWAFFYNGIGIGLAAFGALSPLFSAVAMVSSSLIVLFNARRIS